MFGLVQVVDSVLLLKTIKIFHSRYLSVNAYMYSLPREGANVD